MDDALFYTLPGRLFLNGLVFRYLRCTGTPGRPTAVSLELTHECIARCIMCNIWKIPPTVPNLPVGDWLRLLSSNLLSDLKELDITGGEPFLVADLPDLFAGICALKQKNLKALKTIAITTNGLLTRRVLEYSREIAAMLAKHNIQLVFACAMDAIGPIHDRVRNVKNAWQRVHATIAGLKKLRDRYPDIILGLKTTIVSMNIGELENIVHYAQENDLFTIVSPCIVTGGRYLNLDHGQRLVFDAEDKEKMIRFFRKDSLRWMFHADQMVRLFKTGRLSKPCTCGFNYFFVRSNGEMFLCPLIDKPVGNIRRDPVETLFKSRPASRLRREIGRFPECRQCTEPGLERFSLICEGFTYLRLLFKMGKKKFIRMHRHMGLDKYLPLA